MTVDQQRAALLRVLAVLREAESSALGGNCGMCDHAGEHAHWCPLPAAIADAEALLAEVEPEPFVRDDPNDL